MYKKHYNDLLKLVPINVNMFRYSRANLRVYVLEYRILRPNENVNCTSKDIYTIVVNDCIVYLRIYKQIYKQYYEDVKCEINLMMKSLDLGHSFVLGNG